MERLFIIGFRKVGKWIQNSSRIEHVLNDCREDSNILYCFATGKTLLYVGKTGQPLKKRMYGYQKFNSSVEALAAPDFRVMLTERYYKPSQKNLLAHIFVGGKI